MSKKSSTFASDLKNDNSTLQNYQMEHAKLSKWNMAKW